MDSESSCNYSPEYTNAIPPKRQLQNQNTKHDKHVCELGMACGDC